VTLVAEDDDIVDAVIVEDDPQQWPLYDAALDYLAHGWTPTPLRAKRPTQKRWVGLKPSGADCWAWWVEDNHDGVGIVCGVISRHLIVVDLEAELVADHQAMVRVMLAAAALGAADLVTQALTESSATTPSQGLHLYFEVTDTETVPGNEKLAFKGTGDKAVLLVETRGEGGQVAAPPGAGREWRGAAGPGKATKVTHAQLRGVLDSFRTLDESGIKREPPKPRKPWTPDTHREPSVADAWVEPLMTGAITWADILDEGWTPNKYDDEGRSLWVRPDYGDKTKAPYSAKGFEHWAPGPIPVLVNHSSSVVHLPTGGQQRLTPARVWARCYFGGDEAAANAALEALATTGEIDPRIARPVPTPVLDLARSICADRDARRAAGQDWLNSLPEADLTPPVPPDVEQVLFGATPELEHVRQAARARLISPMALLGAVLARVVAELSPRVVLPPIIGTRASLNMYVGIVGPSGAAKTAAAGVADDLLAITWARARVQGTGSGEGLIASFLRKDPDAAEAHTDPYIIRDDPHVCVLIDEIGMLGSIQNRTGSTLAPVLRSGWSGAALETINADPSRKRVVPKMEYRLTVIAGIQPLAADVLFDDADTGTPQRWMWLPALDRHMPDVEPEWPGPLKWQAPPLHDTKLGWLIIPVPDHIRDTLRAAHRARHRGTDTNHLDGHLALTRLKVAAALAALHGAYAITDQWWELAGLLMDVSMGQRTACQQALAAEAAARAESRGRMTYAQEIGRSKAVAETTERDARRVWAVVAGHTSPDPMASRTHAPDAGCTKRCITIQLPRRDPGQRDQAIEYAVDREWIRTELGRHHPGSSQPAGEAK
jgi:hypothetical protein